MAPSAEPRSQGRGHGQLRSEADPGDDHREEEASLERAWSKASERQTELAGSASGTMTHEGDCCALYCQK